VPDEDPPKVQTLNTGGTIRIIRRLVPSHNWPDFVSEGEEVELSVELSIQPDEEETAVIERLRDLDRKMTSTLIAPRNEPESL